MKKLNQSKKVKIGAIASTLASMSISSAVLTAAEGQPSVESVKEAPALNSKVIKPYASFTLRYYNYQAPEQAASAVQYRTQFRPRIGFSLLDGRYELYARSFVNKLAESTEFKSSGTEVYFVPKSAEFAGGKWGAYLMQSLTPEGDTNYNYVAATTSYSTSIDALKLAGVELGSLSLSMSSEVGASFANNAKSTYKTQGEPTLNPNSLALQQASANLTKDEKSGSYQGDKRSPDLYGELVVGANLKLNAVDGLSLGAYNLLVGDWVEEVIEQGSGELESIYVSAFKAQQLLKVSYAVNDQVSVTNDTWFEQSGKFAKKGGFSALNVTYLSYSLF